MIPKSLFPAQSSSPEFQTPTAICLLLIIKFISKLCSLPLSSLPLESVLTSITLTIYLAQYKLVYLNTLPQYKCQASSMGGEERER